MKFLASLFVGKPLDILAVGVAFVATWFAVRSQALGPGRPPRLLLMAGAGWMLYAA